MAKNNKKSNATVDFQNETFKDKCLDLIADLESELKDLKKQNKFHAQIIGALGDSKDAEIQDCINTTKDVMLNTNKLIDALEERLKHSKTLKQFLDGDLILSVDQFAMLMINVLGSQMVNYIELKNEHMEVSKKWKVEESK